jgi:hypothetical protein
MCRDEEQAATTATELTRSGVSFVRADSSIPNALTAHVRNDDQLQNFGKAMDAVCGRDFTRKCFDAALQWGLDASVDGAPIHTRGKTYDTTPTPRMEVTGRKVVFSNLGAAAPVLEAELKEQHMPYEQASGNISVTVGNVTQFKIALKKAFGSDSLRRR